MNGDFVVFGLTYVLSRLCKKGLHWHLRVSEFIGTKLLIL